MLVLTCQAATITRPVAAGAARLASFAARTVANAAAVMQPSGLRGNAASRAFGAIMAVEYAVRLLRGGVEEDRLWSMLAEGELLKPTALTR